MPSPCADCTRGCCRHYTVTVSGYDAWVIAKNLHMAPEQFLVTVPQHTPNARGFFLDKTGTTYDIALDKTHGDAEAPCVFWLELPGGIGRCGIYSLRPMVCQTYPAFLTGDVVGRRDDVLCADDAWRDGILQKPVWRERLYKMQVDFEIYGLAIARWNYHVLHTPHPEHISVLGFYTYLMNYYARIEPVRAQMSESEWQAMCERWGAACMRGTSPLVAHVDDLEPWSDVITAIYNITMDFFPSDLTPDPEEATEPAPEAVPL
ncbi:MAG TPA: YkgJ family cysteine cluster protein [Chloroflexia bacterium]|nr:YkgJ family cysteine cluster protein [Chloroflexia bacterium]